MAELAEIPGLLAIVGPLAASASQRAARKAQELKVPIVVLSQKKEIASQGSFVFQNYFTPYDQVLRIVDYAIMELGYKRFALLYPENPYGREMMNLFWDRVDELGGTVRGVEGYAPNKTDFSQDIKKLKIDKGLEVLPYFACYGLGPDEIMAVVNDYVGLGVESGRLEARETENQDVLDIMRRVREYDRRFHGSAAPEEAPPAR